MQGATGIIHFPLNATKWATSERGEGEKGIVLDGTVPTHAFLQQGTVQLLGKVRVAGQG